MEHDVSVSAADFKKRLDEGSVRFIFDLRNEEDFSSWRIEGKGPIETINIPQFRFVGEVEKYLEAFPRDRQITVVCAHGDASRYSAAELQGHGFDAVSLEGGMDAWSGFYETAKISVHPEIYQIFRTARGCISYLISSGGNAAVIDAARHLKPIMDLAASLGVKVTHVLDTHLHADHISGGRELAEIAGAAYHINPADVEGAAFGYLALTDGQEINIGKGGLMVIHSPGHTPGSTSFLLDGKFLFTGDTIMKEGIGRPDLGGMAEQWAAMLHETLFTRIAALPDETVVLPSHASSIREQDDSSIIKATLGEARRGIELYRIRELKPFISHVMSTLPKNPESYQEIRQVNLGSAEADEAKKKELEIGKNLCGMAKQQGS